jgi:putative tricarboxylic transport membrane protein
VYSRRGFDIERGDMANTSPRWLWLAAAVLLGVHGIAAAQLTYPRSTVTLITHSSPGGGSDVFLRDLARHLSRHIAANFVVENVRGGSGARALTRIATARPDGGMFYAATPTFVFTSLMGRPQHDHEDLLPLVNLFFDQEVIYTRSNGPFTTLAEVIEAARAGRGRWGASTPGSLERRALEQLKQAAGVEAAIVTHEGGGDLILNVLNGTLDIGVGEAQELRSQLDAGRVRLLAIFGEARLPAMPDLPTVKESGFDITVEKFRGLMAPKDTPPEIIALWERAAQAVLEDPEYRRLYTEQMLTPGYMSSARYTEFLDTFIGETEVFLRESGVIR